MAIDERVIDEVSNASDIVSVIGEYIPLKRAGQNFKACCPFHQEKTPSFVVSPQKQIFHCFGCGEGGNVFSFLMKYEQMSFPEAVRFLANKSGIIVPEERAKVNPEKVSEKKQMEKIYEVAAAFYKGLLFKSTLAENARDYLKKRGISSDVATEFGLGFSPEGWHELFDHLNKAGFDNNLIMKSGLVMTSRKGSAYDFFRGRLMFPIKNVKDKVIAFGGRTLEKEEPKYINTAETDFFRKRFELYGLNGAKKHVYGGGPADGVLFVVEGYLDVISLAQFGIKNSVAPLGTSLTEDHVRVIKRYSDSAVLVFDGDNAGIKAAMRSIDSFISEEVPVKILMLPEGHDPDTFVREKGADAFYEKAAHALDIFDFKLKVLERTYSVDDPDGALKISQAMLDLVSKVRSPVLKDKYIYMLSAAVRVSEGALRDALKKMSFNSSYSPERFDSVEPVLQPVKPRRKTAIRDSAEFQLLYILLTNPKFGKLVFEELDADDFESNAARVLFAAAEKVFNAGEILSFAALTNKVEDQEAAKALSELALIEIDVESIDSALLSRLKEIHYKGLEKKRREAHANIQKAERAGDSGSSLKWLQEKMNIERQIQKLKNK